MAENSKIEWTHHSANFWWGCVKVSPLCDHCYAERDSARYGHSVFGLDARRRFIMSVGMSVDKWQRQAKTSGLRKRVFVMSMGDFFEQLPDGHPDRSHMEAVRIEACALMEVCVDLEFLVLTKRISNVAKMVPSRWLKEWPSHIRLGVSVGTQKDADRDIPRLLEINCPNFLSMEPLLERVDIGKYDPGHCDCDVCSRTIIRCTASKSPIDWIITGGESGPQARPSHPDWFRLLRDQCASAGVPFLFKQWGEWASGCSLSNGDMVFREFRTFDHWVAKASTWINGGICLDTCGKNLKMGLDFEEARDEGRFPVTVMHRIGKHRSGRLLDGVQHDGYPIASETCHV